MTHSVPQIFSVLFLVGKSIVGVKAILILCAVLRHPKAIWELTEPLQSAILIIYPQAVINAIDVASVDEYCEKVIAAGGTITVPKMAVPTMGWVAYFTDTEGNTHGLWQTDPNAA
jgi:hypothetical protein